MPVTKEQALEELKLREVDVSQFSAYPPEANIKSQSKAAAYHVLKERGMSDDDITTALKDKAPKAKFPEFWESLVKDIPEYGGAILGGIVGTPAGPLGAIAGAGLGGAAGKAYQQIGEHVLGDPDVPKTSLEAAKEIGIAGGKQAAYEAGGRLVIGGINKVLSPFGKSVTPESVIAQKTLEQYMPKETSPFRLISKLRGEKAPALLPAEATQNRTLDILENIAEGSLIGGKKIADYKTIVRPEAISNMMDDLVNQFGQRAEPDLVGEAFTMAVEKSLKPSRLAATTLYNTVDDMTKNIGIPTQSLKKFAQPLAERAKEIGSIEAKNAGDDLVQAIMELPETISYGSMKELRSRLISKIDEFSIINKKAPAIGKAKQLVSLSDNAIENTLKTENPEALGLWRQANKLYREGSEQFDNEFIRRLIKQSVDKGNPEVIGKQIFKPAAISNIRKAKGAVDEGTWKQLQGWYLQDVIKKSTTVEGEIVGKTFLDQLTGKTGMGKQALSEIFNPTELKSILDVATTLEITTKKQAEGIGRMWIQLTQAGAVVGLADERTRPYSVALLGAPAVLARLFTNPIAAKWLIQGAKLPASSPQAAAILTKLSGLAVEIGQDMKRKGEIPSTHKEIQQLKGESTLRGISPAITKEPAKTQTPVESKPVIPEISEAIVPDKEIMSEANTFPEDLDSILVKVKGKRKQSGKEFNYTITAKEALENPDYQSQRKDILNQIKQYETKMGNQ